MTDPKTERLDRLAIDMIRTLAIDGVQQEAGEDPGRDHGDASGAARILLRAGARRAGRAYERLLSDALEGRQALFARQDGVEECWRIVEPALRPTQPVRGYASGSWGPDAADQLIKPVGTWHTPQVLT